MGVDLMAVRPAGRWRNLSRTGDHENPALVRRRKDIRKSGA
jgi:hypothetical protein